MNIYFSQFRKEWNLFLKKQLVKFSCAFLLGAAAGILLINLVCRLGGGTSYIHGGAVFGMIFAFVWTFVIGNELTAHFLLGVSMGQKRKNLIGAVLLFLGVLTVVSYAAVNVLMALEEMLYSVLFPGLRIESAWMPPVLFKWGVLIIGIVLLLIWLFFILNLRYGAKVFWIPYILYMVVFIISTRFAHTAIGEVFGTFFLAIAHLPEYVWLMLGAAAVVLIVLIGSRILMRLDVK